MDSLQIPRKLWEHPNPKSTAMYRFMQEVNKKHNLQLDTFWDLWQYSTTRRANFWDQAFQSFNLIYSGSYTKVVDENARIDSIPKWFEGINMNFAENMLYTRAPGAQSSERGTIGKEDDKIALTEVREGYTEVKNVTWGQLRKEVAELASAMKAHGVGKGDRVVIVASNSVDTLKVFMAVTSLGGLFSSSSTDMGVQGILQRALQVEPKYIFMDDWTVYNGKTVDLRRKMADIVNGMKGVKEFQGMVSMPRFKQPADIGQVPRTQQLSTYISKATSTTLGFQRVAFRDPFFIAYSSGTTGTPKCIVHSVGGTLLSVAKESIFHMEAGPRRTVLQYTTTGWIMYFSSVANLLTGARLILYDGSPFQPDLTTFVKMIGELKVSHLGTSPRWMVEMQKNGIVPKDVTDLSHLETVTSTGMVLSDQLFEWFYDVGFPKHVHLANISGGTDIAGCFGQGNPLTPVYVGGTQGPSLGTPVAVYDSLIEGGKGVRGELVEHGTPGELVATAAFPNMPVYFWNDPDGSRYFSAYFEKYDNVWTHGDFVQIHPTTKNLLFLGRADGVLNPSGVRFGSAEIYSVLEKGFPQIEESICVGQRRPQDEDERVMLFLMMREGEKFTQKLVDEVKAAIRKELSARHVPKFVFETPEIPTTVNLKKVELPVKQIVSGKIIKPSGTLLNPKSLDFYYQFAKVEELIAGTKSKL
ncbi:acetoacetate- ligase protein [Rutstroemia sp. NJR-2017a WRK4]|nr:acetoacetate- ligase protein [Rutstroemia sp. NJR-2017a WRK4]